MSEGGKAGQRQSRDLRLGAALRENLKRRKAQALRRKVPAGLDDEQPGGRGKTAAGRGELDKADAPAAEENGRRSGSGRQG